MYENFFGLTECPFNITPDPRYVYFSQHHKEALSLLLYGIHSRRGFIQITGEIGAGKTTLCRALLKELKDQVHTSIVFNPRLSEFEILQVIVEDFGIEPAGKKKKDYYDALARFLLTEMGRGYNAVVILDEAQLLSPRALEQIRLLSNLETPTQKLIQIIFVGQPELKDLMQRKGLEQLRQRIAIRYHLPSLIKDDMQKYIDYRMEVAGGRGDVFTREALELIYNFSGGIPRIINMLADRAMLAAFTRESRVIDTSVVELAHMDVQGVAV